MNLLMDNLIGCYAYFDADMHMHMPRALHENNSIEMFKECSNNM